MALFISMRFEDCIVYFRELLGVHCSFPEGSRVVLLLAMSFHAISNPCMAQCSGREPSIWPARKKAVAVDGARSVSNGLQLKSYHCSTLGAQAESKLGLGGNWLARGGGGGLFKPLSWTPPPFWAPVTGIQTG